MVDTWSVRDPGPALATVAGVLADRTRAAVCLCLMDGRAWTAGELAGHVGVGRPTMTEHLHRLVESGIATEEHQGRHRYVRLSGPDAADLLEQLTGWAHRDDAPRVSGVPSGWEIARTCYDHLAGRVGVALCDALVDQDWVRVRTGADLTETGTSRLAELGIVVHPGRGAAVRSCLDWTERRPHLAGGLGRALLRHALDSGWLSARDGRRLIVTRHGQQELPRQLGVDPAALGPTR